MNTVTWEHASVSQLWKVKCSTCCKNQYLIWSWGNPFLIITIVITSSMNIKARHIYRSFCSPKSLWYFSTNIFCLISRPQLEPPMLPQIKKKKAEGKPTIPVGSLESNYHHLSYVEICNEPNNGFLLELSKKKVDFDVLGGGVPPFLFILGTGYLVVGLWIRLSFLNPGRSVISLKWNALTV